MADHTLNALRAAARAMEEVVLPAVDKEHPLANEQARFVLKYLRLFESRLDLASERNRFELRHYLSLADGLRDGPLPASPSIVEALDEAIAEGRDVDGRIGGRATELQAAGRRLAGVISALVRLAGETDDASRERIDRLVLTRAKELLDLQRAWFLPQGWEPDPSKVPSLETLLARAT